MLCTWTYKGVNVTTKQKGIKEGLQKIHWHTSVGPVGPSAEPNETSFPPKPNETPDFFLDHHFGARKGADQHMQMKNPKKVNTRLTTFFLSKQKETKRCAMQ